MEGKKLKGVGPVGFAEVTGRSERDLVMSHCLCRELVP